MLVRALLAAALPLQGASWLHPTSAVPRVHRKLTVAAAQRRLVFGLNKYSHDTAICVVDADTHQIVFAAEKERITRRKHDGGDAGDLVVHALETLGNSVALEQFCRAY